MVTLACSENLSSLSGGAWTELCRESVVVVDCFVIVVAAVLSSLSGGAWTELCVVMVSMVRMPSEMRAGTDSRSIQNETQDSRTTSRLGRNVDRM